ncbi:threonine--tRNA ligase [Candidatus Woesearchaeota archaeon]|nr:MAG: threonine--tRNA ligase [Candidatus Woesearchaeota archaeon]
MVEVTFPDGKKKKYEKGVTALDVAQSISEGLAREIVACELDGETKDLTTTLEKDTTINFLKPSTKEGLEVLRHSTAHIMAEAVLKVRPDAKMTIGPVIEDGFFYDFDTEPFTPEDLTKIEAEMKKIVKEKKVFKRIEVSKADAKKEFKGNKYKEELIDELEEGTVTIYQHDDFKDLCRGPHIQNTGQAKNFKAMKVAAAYWRGDAKNTQLQRIYGTVFATKEDLQNYITRIEEAEKRDHRKLGKKLELFSFHEEAPGCPFWHPKGMTLRSVLTDYWRKEHQKEGYVEINTPIILNRKLWETSGHWENYKENMYTTKIDGEDFAVKPMNCPGGMLQYKEKVHSYKEFPLRVGELGLVHRHELSGALSGLFRVRMFTQDDSHIFMTPNQITGEIARLIRFVDRIYKQFGFEYHVELSTRPDKSIGSDKQWELATNGLKDGIKAAGLDYEINEGDGAFYGPKIDFHIKDAIGRTWQCGTIQLDMSLPERFDLTYTGEDGNNDHRPVMIHRVIYGSFERFIGILIEHYAGKFPLWLSPVQVRVLTVADRHKDFAEEVKLNYEKSGLRVEIDNRTETIGKKVREAQLDQINYILVVGDQEIEKQTVTVRTRNNEVVGQKDVSKFRDELLKEVNKKE